LGGCHGNPKTIHDDDVIARSLAKERMQNSIGNKYTVGAVCEKTEERSFGLYSINDKASKRKRKMDSQTGEEVARTKETSIVRKN
jgi:hypothetical protein